MAGAADLALSMKMKDEGKGEPGLRLGVLSRQIKASNLRLEDLASEAIDVESEVYCRRRSGNFWRMRARPRH